LFKYIILYYNFTSDWNLSSGDGVAQSV
jgi:hypothetical protein